jgi:RecA/RadA recombinase
MARTKKSEEIDGTEELNAPELKEVKIKSKKTFSLTDYKKNIDIKEIEYKEDEWIPLSRAFQDTTQLPGIPMYSVTMVYGHPDSGKSTLALEATRGAISSDILPIFINTEKKFNWSHAIEMGINPEDVLYVDSIEEVEDITKFVRDRLRDQREGVLPTDILFVIDSIGNVVSKAERAAIEKEEDGAIMKTAKVLTQQIHRVIEKQISATKRADFPYSATLLIVNHAYEGTNANMLIPYGGKGIIKAASLVIRMGGIISNSTKVYATKEGVNVSFAIKTAIVVEKNHITNISIKDKILCTAHGFVRDTTSDLNNYKKEHRTDWELRYDKDWAKYDGE